MRILADMNLSPQIIEYASANGLVIFTLDLDFGALLAARKTRPPSVIQIRMPS